MKKAILSFVLIIFVTGMSGCLVLKEKNDAHEIAQTTPTDATILDTSQYATENPEESQESVVTPTIPEQIQETVSSSSEIPSEEERPGDDPWSVGEFSEDDPWNVGEFSEDDLWGGNDSSEDDQPETEFTEEPPRIETEFTEEPLWTEIESSEDGSPIETEPVEEDYWAETDFTEDPWAAGDF